MIMSPSVLVKMSPDGNLLQEVAVKRTAMSPAELPRA